MRISIWLVRHGQTELNRQRRFQGAIDSPLTDYGRVQAAALARRLARIRFDVAITSPAGRARATAEAVVGQRTIPIVEDARWAETRHGRWEGLTYREGVARYPEEAAQRLSNLLHGRPEGGESLSEVHVRVAEAWNSILTSRPGGRVLVSTHATPIQLLLCSTAMLPPTLHWRWRIDLGSLTVIDVYAAGPIVRVVNEVPLLGRAGLARGDG